MGNGDYEVFKKSVLPGKLFYVQKACLDDHLRITLNPMDKLNLLVICYLLCYKILTDLINKYSVFFRKTEVFVFATSFNV